MGYPNRYATRSKFEISGGGVSIVVEEMVASEVLMIVCDIATGRCQCSVDDCNSNRMSRKKRVVIWLRLQ